MKFSPVGSMSCSESQEAMFDHKPSKPTAYKKSLKTDVLYIMLFTENIE